MEEIKLPLFARWESSFSTILGVKTVPETTRLYMWPKCSCMADASTSSPVWFTLFGWTIVNVRLGISISYQIKRVCTIESIFVVLRAFTNEVTQLKYIFSYRLCVLTLENEYVEVSRILSFYRVHICRYKIIWTQLSIFQVMFLGFVKL